MYSLAYLLGVADGGPLTAKEIKAITGIDNSAFAAELMVKLTALRSLNKLTMKTLATSISALNKKYKVGQRTVEHFSSACDEVAREVLRISADNKSRRDEYTRKYTEWAANPQKLGQQIIKKAQHSCDNYTNTWNRDVTCREEYGDQWEDAQDSYDWRPCGYNGVEWACRKKKQVLDQEIRDYANQRPPEVNFEPLPSLECLTCSQNITFTGDRTVVDESSLQQAIQCSIGSDDSPTSSPATGSKDDVPSEKRRGLILLLIPVGILVFLVVVVIIFIAPIS